MNGGAIDNIAYSMMTLIPAKKRMIDKVLPAKIPLKCWCQLLGAEDKKRFIVNSRIVCFYEGYPVFVDTTPFQCKENKFMWY